MAEEPKKEGVKPDSELPAELQKPEEEPAPQAKPGDKTNPNLLLKSLQEEREKRQELEERLKKLEESSIPAEEPEEEYLSDEAKGLKKEIGSLKETIKSMEERQTLKELQAKYPALTDNLDKFNEFKKDYPNHKLENVTKLFLVEEGLMETNPQRKGLEKPTGGSKTPAPQEGYTVEEARNIRENDPKLYEKLVRERRLKIVSSE